MYNDSGVLHWALLRRIGVYSTSIPGTSFAICSLDPVFPIRRLTLRSGKVSKPGDLYSELDDCSEIWQAPWHHCWWGTRQISKRLEKLTPESRVFETSLDLTIRRLIGYWDRSLGFNLPTWPVPSQFTRTSYSPEVFQLVASTAVKDLGHPGFKYHACDKTGPLSPGKQNDVRAWEYFQH